MPTHAWPWPAAATRRTRYCRTAIGAVILPAALLLQACASTAPRPFAGAKVSNPDIRVPPAIYRSAVGGYSSQRPTEPAPWRERNDGVTPEPKKDGQ